MKIGIITHQYINNFGAFLQAYALREAIAKLYPNDTVEIINYVNRKHAAINTCGWFRFYPVRENLKCWFNKIKLPGTFSKERKKYMKMSKYCVDAKSINDMGYDCILIGSDEVWNYKDTKSFDPIKFGIGLEAKKIIAYAPSVGKTSEDLPMKLQEGIRSFYAVSARDDLTAEQIEKIRDEQAVRVLDPTFLSEFPIAEVKNVKKPYILFYYCENLAENVKNQIFEFAKENGYEVYGAGECDTRYSDITVNLTPFEWISMFKNAEYVFTGTFHGAVFSILNRRQFKVFLSNESRIKKVKALLKELNIQNRIIDEDYVFDINAHEDDIEYDAVYEIIERKCVISREYLKRSIEG